MSIKWKEDPSPLHLFECGESAFVGKWKLHIDKMKTLGESDLMNSVLRSLTKKEKKVLSMRFDLDGNPISEIDSYMEKHEKRKAWQKSHPYQWRVDYHEDDAPKLFSGLGGSARTAEEGKALAEAAVKYAQLAYDALKTNENA